MALFTGLLVELPFNTPVMQAPATLSKVPTITVRDRRFSPVHGNVGRQSPRKRPLRQGKLPSIGQDQRSPVPLLRSACRLYDSTLYAIILQVLRSAKPKPPDTTRACSLLPRGGRTCRWGNFPLHTTTGCTFLDGAQPVLPGYSVVLAYRVG